MENICENMREQIPELITGTLATEKADTIRHHVDQCSACREYLRALRADDKLLGDFAEAMQPRLARLENNVIDALGRESSVEWLSPVSMWRKVMKSRISKLAAAAVIVVVVIIAAYNLGRSVDGASVAWGQVAHRVEEIPGATYRRTEINNQGTLGSGICEEIVYLSGHKVRVDSFEMGGVHPYFHWLSIGKPPLGLRVHQYAEGTQPENVGVLVYLEDDPNKPSSDPGMDIYENLKRWWRERKHIDLNIDEYLSRGFRTSYFFPDERVFVFDTGDERSLSEEEAVKWFKRFDPREWTKEALSLDYRELGHDNINGVDVEGVEVQGRNLSVAPFLHANMGDVTIRFWVDIKTGLPVRYEARARYGRWEGDWAMVVDEIDWNQALDPSIFEPNVPVE